MFTVVTFKVSVVSFRQSLATANRFYHMGELFDLNCGTLNLRILSRRSKCLNHRSFFRHLTEKQRRDEGTRCVNTVQVLG